MSQISKKARFGAKTLLFALIILNFNVAGASAAGKHEITPETMLEFTNASRREAGIYELKSNSKLVSAAEAKIGDMFSSQYFEHNSPSGVTPWYWIKSAGYEYSYAGENLAIDFISAEGTHQAFMESSSHRENILNANYEEIGIAVRKGIFEGEETIIVVEEFGAISKIQTPPVLSSKDESKKPIEIKNINISEKENENVNLNQIPNNQTEKIEEAIIESQIVLNEDTGDQNEDIAIDESELEKLESGNNLFVDSLYYPNTIFEKQGICLGAVEKEKESRKELKNINAGEVARKKLLADSYLIKKYDSFISSLDSFENEIILFLLSVTMTMNLVYISSENIRKE
ncbi:MAG: CAP domain-containing protein [Minisyncoccia bacterium]